MQPWSKTIVEVSSVRLLSEANQSQEHVLDFWSRSCDSIRKIKNRNFYPLL